MDASKSYAGELHQIVSLLLEELKTIYPTLTREFERDLASCHRLVENRGLQLYAVDFPAVAKHLDRCLDDGAYISSGLPTTSRFSRSVPFPKLFRGLYLRIFEQDGSLKEEADVLAITYLRQLLYLGKKVRATCADSDVSREIDEFVIVDDSLPPPPLGWEGEDPSDVVGYHPFSRMEVYDDDEGRDEVAVELLHKLDRVVKLVCSSLGDYNSDNWDFRHGPGAIAERTGPGNKYRFTNWSDRLDRVFPASEVAFASYRAWVDNVIRGGLNGNEGTSRLIAVPKTLRKPRLIAAEPSEHVWCQQNIWHYFASRSAACWIKDFLDFRDQSLNQKLCVEASAGLPLATLDLSSASDRVTCRAVDGMFWRLPNLHMSLAATRTRFVELPDGSLVYLRKYSTMGNSTTFPVESLIFLSVCLAAVLVKRGARVTERTVRELKGQVAVFGDDLIVPIDCRDLTVKLLNMLKFKVNEAKSFSGKNFRESCGVDAFRGQVVTPVYWKEPNSGKPESVASVVETRNNFYSKYHLLVASYLASTIHPRHAAFVPADSGVFGLKTRCCPDPRLLYKSRWNKDLHRVEVRLPILSGRERRTVDEDDTVLLQYFTEEPPPFESWMAGYRTSAQVTIKPAWVPLEELVS